MRGRSIARDFADGRPGSITVLRQWRAQGWQPQKLIVALGTNNITATNAYWDQEISRVMQRSGPTSRSTGSAWD